MPLYDSHCHLSPSINADVYQNSVVPRLRNSSLPMIIMTTNHIDINFILKILEDDQIGSNVELCLGIHPWWSHLFTIDGEVICKLKSSDQSVLDQIKHDHYCSILAPNKNSTIEEFHQLLSHLPLPMPLNDHLDKFKLILDKYSSVNIGEIGLDKNARIPSSGFLGNQTAPPTGLSSYKIKMDHQLKIMEIQLNLAQQYGKFVSVHNVQSSSQIIEFVKKYNDIRWVLHSYSGSEDSAKQLLKLGDIWFGLSNIINMKNESKLKSLLGVIGERSLIETDFGIDDMIEEVHIEELSKIESFVNEKFNVQDNWQRFKNT